MLIKFMCGLVAARGEGHAEGLVEELEEDRAKGEFRFAKLTQLLLEFGHLCDLSKAIAGLEYRRELYLQYNL